MTNHYVNPQPSSKEQKSQTDVLLISMPFGQLFAPSIGLSLLKTALRNEDFNVGILYTTFFFAELIGTDFYSYLASGAPAATDLVGEWIFSKGLFDQSESQVRAYIDNIIFGHNCSYSKEQANPALKPKQLEANLLIARQYVNEFLDICLKEIKSCNPSIVGFTSVFQQHLASLSLAKRLKTEIPEIFIVFGGANCEGIMGLETMRQFSFIDALVSGEGELIFPELVKRVKNKLPINSLQGVYSRNSNFNSSIFTNSFANTPTVRDINKLPFPDYDDYFDQLKKSAVSIPTKPHLLFETSRGCWWGEKSHCTFCGLNGNTMTYRSKSSDRALSELIWLTKRYPDYPISVVDNILDIKYFKDFIPKLANLKLPAQLFYEVKSNLTKEQVRLLKAAGITTIQPGIESLSNQVLQLMGKGVTALQNIQLLKWCKEFGVQPDWNIIWGFPKESPEEYGCMAELTSLLTHLPPPIMASAFRLDRFSPNYTYSKQMGIIDIKPYPAYSYVYPFTPNTLANLAYYFTYNYADRQNISSYTVELAKQIKIWQDSYKDSDFFYIDKGTHLLLCDFRPISTVPLTILSEYKRLLYVSCDSAKTPEQVYKLLLSKNFTSLNLNINNIIELLNLFVDKRLMIKIHNSYLSLAIPTNTYSPNKQVLKKLIQILKKLGQASNAEETISLDINNFSL